MPGGECQDRAPYFTWMARGGAIKSPIQLLNVRQRPREVFELECERRDKPHDIRQLNEKPALSKVAGS